MATTPALLRRFRYCRVTYIVAALTVVFIFIILLAPEVYDETAGPYYAEQKILYDDHLDAQAPMDVKNTGWFSLGSKVEEPVVEGLRYADDGLVRGWDEVHEVVSAGKFKRVDKKRLKEASETHPIEVLMKRGQERWDQLLANQSKTLPQAVTEYTRRYGRPPPKGFEAWWQFCKRNGVKIVDDYDQIDRDISPFFALSPETFAARVEALKSTPHSYRISLYPSGETSITGTRSDSSRAIRLFHLISPLAIELPTDVSITVSDHDLGSWLLGDDQKQAALRAIKRGRYLSETQLKSLERRDGRVNINGLVSACPPGSSAWNRKLGQNWTTEAIGDAKETTFIHDPRTTADFCYNPELLEQHGALSFDFTRETVLRPIFQLTKFSRNPEFLTTPLEAYENATSKAAMEKYLPWEEKTVNKLFWRGSSTGDSYSKRKNYDWRQSHRPRLHLLAQAEEGEKGIWVKKAKGGWEKQSWRVKRLNQMYMDVGLTGQPHQCNVQDGTCDEMAEELHFKERVKPEQAVRYKYVMDVDGNGWSSRFHRLLLSGSVVVKSTIYPEWYSDWLTPWVHYVPSQVDYSDLYSILSFFIGSPDGRNRGRDELAREIAENARKFALEHWRWEDMQAYMFRLLLEYARLLSPDREAWSYEKTYE